MALPGFISDEEMAALEQGQMPLSRGKVTFEFPGSSAPAQQVEQPAVGFISDEQMAQMEAANQQSRPQVDLLGEGTTIQRAGRNVIGGISQFLPFGDEIVAGGASLVDAVTGQNDLSDAYDLRLGEVRNYQKSYNQLSPEGGWLPSIAGGIALPLGGAATKVKAIAPKLAAMSAEGGVLGGIYGFAGGEGIDDRLSKAKDSAKFSAVASPVIGGSLMALQGLGPKLVKEGQKLDRKSIGASYSDYAKSAEDIKATNLTDEAVSKTKSNLDELLASGELGTSRNPAKLKKLVSGKSRDLSMAIDAELRAAQGSAGTVIPQFPRAESLIDEGKIPADQIPRYEKRLSELMGNIVKLGKGKLTYLQQQKIALGKMYDPNDTLANNFNRALYHDLQESIEKAAPAVKPLNRQLEKFKTIEPILQRGTAKLENSEIINRALGVMRTSGGVGASILAGGAAAGAPGAITAGAVGYGLTNPQGQRILGRSLQSVGLALPKKANPPTALIAALGALASEEEPRKGQQNGSSALQQNKATISKRLPEKALSPRELPSNLQKQQNKRISEQELKYLEGWDSSSKSTKTVREPQELSGGFRSLAEALAPAVIKVESGGKNDAVSPKGAAGLMQLMPRTAKNLGVSDRFDPEQNVEGGIKLLAEELARFKSVPLALAAFNAGSPRVMKAIEKAGTTDPIQVMKHLPAETQNYLPKVMKALESMA